MFKTSRKIKSQQLTSRLHNLDNNYPSSIDSYERYNMKTINKNIKPSYKQLRNTLKNHDQCKTSFKTKNTRSNLDHNSKYVKYLSNLIRI